MQRKLLFSSLFLSLYLAGLSLYFYVTGATGTRSSVLTGLFQMGSLVAFLGLACAIPECRKKLLQIKLIDILTLGFFVAVILDLNFFQTSETSKLLPPNILSYFCVYTFALFVSRCLTFQQFKLILYLTGFISILTSLLLFYDFTHGSAVAVNNSSRLAVGDSGNPIEAGNLGAYAALASLLFSLKAKALPIKFGFLALMYPSTMVALLSGTRSAVISIAVGSAFLIATTLIFEFKAIAVGLRRMSVSSFSYFFLILLLLTVSPIISSGSSSTSSSATASTSKGFNLERTWSRLSNIPLLSDEAPDESLKGRYHFYDHALSEFSKSPLLGTRVYSTGFAHNAFLQVLAEFGTFGVLTYILPAIYLYWRFGYVLWLSLKRKANYFGTADWTVTAFMGLLLIQTLIVLLVHADPYRSYSPPCVIGMAIAFSRLGLDKKLQAKSSRVEVQFQSRATPL